MHKHRDFVFENILKKYSESLGIEDMDKVFEYFSAEQLLKQQDFDNEEIESGLVGKSKDNGIDGFYIIVDDELINSFEQIREIRKNVKKIELHVHQYKNTHKISENVVLKFINAFKDILNFENKTLEGWDYSCKEKIELFRKIVENTAYKSPDLIFYIKHISKGNYSNIEKNTSYWSKVENLKKIIQEGDLSGIKIEFNYLGLEELKKLYKIEKSYELELNLKDAPLPLEFKEEKNLGFIAIVNLKDYFDFICDKNTRSLKKHLFDNNVRDFQNGTKVNNQITETLENDKELEFWWLNNGITIIASASNQIGKKLHLTNVKIVNGLQTSYSIYNTFIKEEIINDDRSLLVKIIINEDQKTIDKIIKSTNSQTAVASSSLRATDDIQREIEDYFKQKDYFYDRRKNYYKNQGYPIKKIVSINFLAQCINALLIDNTNPSESRASATKLTESDKSYNKLFDIKRYSLESYFKAVIIVKRVIELIREYQEMDIKKIEKNTEVDIILKYFTFHLSRILVSIVLKKGKYGNKEIEKINVEEIVTDRFEESLNLLKEILKDYQNDEKEELNLINISKNTKFGSYITEKLIEKYKKLKNK